MMFHAVAARRAVAVAERAFDVIDHATKHGKFRAAVEHTLRV